MSGSIGLPQWLCKCGVIYRTEIAKDLCIARAHESVVKATMVIHQAMLLEAHKRFDAMEFGIPVHVTKKQRVKRFKNVCVTCGNPTHVETALGRPSKFCVGCKKTRLRGVEVGAKVRKAKWMDRWYSKNK